MDALIPFSLRFSGMKFGVHRFDFQIDKAFFAAFSESPIKSGNVQVELTLDKRPQLLVLDFNYEGTVDVVCDRCLSPCALPIEGLQQFLAKPQDQETEQAAAEIVYYDPDAATFSVAELVYETLVLALPMIKVCTVPKTCDPKVLAYLNGEVEIEDEETGSSEDNPFAKALKDFDKNNN